MSSVAISTPPFTTDTHNMSEEVRKSSVRSAHRTSVAENQVTSVLSRNEVPVFERELDADEAALAALGYKYDRTQAKESTLMLTTL